MVFSDFFKDVVLSNIKNKLNEILSNLDILLSYNNEAETNFNKPSWISRAKTPLLNGLNTNEVIINNLKNQVQIFLNSLAYAEKIIEIQNKMRSTDDDGNYELDEHDLYGGRAEIDRQLYYFYQEISKMSDSIGLSGSINNYASNSSELKFDVEMFDNAIDFFAKKNNESAKKIQTLVESLEDMVITDDCLKYGYKVLYSLSSFLRYRIKYMEDWIYSYRNNIVSDLDSKLPDEENIILGVGIDYYNKVALEKNTYSLPSIEEYAKLYRNDSYTEAYFNNKKSSAQDTYNSFKEKYENGEISKEEKNKLYDEYMSTLLRSDFEKNSYTTIKELETKIKENEETLGPSHGYDEGRGKWGGSDNLFNLYNEFMEAMRSSGEDIEESHL